MTDKKYPECDSKIKDGKCDGLVQLLEMYICTLDSFDE